MMYSYRRPTWIGAIAQVNPLRAQRQAWFVLLAFLLFSGFLSPGISRR